MTGCHPAGTATAGRYKDIGRLLLRCPDRSGIIAAVTTFLTEAGANIISLDQHSTQPEDGTFLQRTVFHLPGLAAAGPELVGATAHYVTENLDEGPIIEQDVVRVDHTHTVEDLVRLGADVERAVLSRAVLWHCQDRVVRHGGETVIFCRGELSAWLRVSKMSTARSTCC